SKIIAAKNAVSRSPIKAVNLGDISGKASNGISNTPKDAQVTASGLTNKFTMLEVLINGIACDLEKAIQQDPDKERHCEQIFEVDRGMEVEGELNNKEMEVDLEKTDAHKTIDVDKQGASWLKDMDFHNKSQCIDSVKHSKISALTPKTLSSFDAQFDPVKVVSTVEEPSSVLHANDIPSFDMGLTPTPPDVNINANKQDVSNQEPSTTLLPNDAPSFDFGLMPTPPDVNLDTGTKPMLENEDVKKNAKEQGLTNITSPVDALALSFAMSNTTLVTPAIERKRKDLPMLENERVKKNAKEPGPTNTRTAFDAVPLSFSMSNAALVTPAIERKRTDFEKENILKEANDKESKKMK
ncbi:hypothetical protein Tco_1533420, partial [Tanacetum coccineum]